MATIYAQDVKVGDKIISAEGDTVEIATVIATKYEVILCPVAYPALTFSKTELVQIA